MKTLHSILGILALAFAGSAQAILLTSLLEGGSIQVNDKLFTDWQIISQDTSDGHTVNTNNIDVTGLVDNGSGPGLQFDILNNEFDVTGDGVDAYIDFLFGFHVSVLDPDYQIKDNSLRLESASLLNITDYLGMSISEDITDAAGNLLGTKYVEFSQEVGVGGAADLTDTAEFDPQSEIWVTKNILVWATDPNETASLGRFSQRFSQAAVPEPATLMLMGVGLAGLGFTRRKMKA
jgi:hypothetical protein